jgi:hypothetical protein
MDFGMGKRPPFDRDMIAYVDRSPLRRHYRFYERTEPAGAEPAPDIAAFERHREGRLQWRADEDEIADGAGRSSASMRHRPSG